MEKNDKCVCFFFGSIYSLRFVKSGEKRKSCGSSPQINCLEQVGYNLLLD